MSHHHIALRIVRKSCSAITTGVEIYKNLRRVQNGRSNPIRTFFFFLSRLYFENFPNPFFLLCGEQNTSEALSFSDSIREATGQIDIKNTCQYV